MGLSNKFVLPFYRDNIVKSGKVGYLGDVGIGEGDCYDLSLGNWDINSDWELPRRYNTLICTRTAPFSKDPLDFITRCYKSLEAEGKLYVDWLYGEHWRFPLFKVGWLRQGEHEYAYGEENHLWSGVWDESFTESPEVRKFFSEIAAGGFYSDETVLRDLVKVEVPSMLELKEIEAMFNTRCHFLYCNVVAPSLYVLLECSKRGDADAK